MAGDDTTDTGESTAEETESAGKPESEAAPGATAMTADDAAETEGDVDEERPIVVKVGGARAVDPAGALADVKELVDAGEPVVVVHGGSTAVDELLEDLGEEPEYVETPEGVTGRFTDERAMEAFTMAMAGQVNTALTVALRNQDVNAVGLSGVDGGLLTGPRKSAVRVQEGDKEKIRRGDHSGRIEDVNADLLETLLAAGYTPVISVPMLGEEDDGVLAVNADADRAAAAVAGALGGRLVVLTDVAGVYEDPDDESTLIEDVDTPADLDRAEEAAEGFMTRKVMAVEEALAGGAIEAIVSDANVEDPILAALSGRGTRFAPTALQEEVAG